MGAAEQEAVGVPPVPEILRPEAGAEKLVDLDAGAQRKREKPPSPTERYEARVDSYLAELKRDKQELEEEVRRLRFQEIHHLREDLRWLEDLASWQGQELVKIRTLHASAIAFSWLSFVLVIVGGGVVSYAALLHPAWQFTIATLGFVGLVIGVAVQGINLLVGEHLARGKTEPPGADARPRPNPHVPR